MGNLLYDSYFKAFPGLKKYYENLKRTSLKRGYILIDPITNRRLNFITPKSRSEEGAVGRKCLNAPVQGTAGSMTKLALIYLDKELVKHNLKKFVVITNVVHDRFCRV